MNKRIGGAVLALAAAVVFAAACGSSNDQAPGGGASGGTDYASCLRNNGVDLSQFNQSNGPTARPSGRPSGLPSGQPRPSGGEGFPGPDGVDQQAWEKAQQACAALRPTAFPGGGGANPGGGRDAAYRNCLTEHGVSVTGTTDRLDTSDSKVAAAVQACEALKPAPAAS
ncbi:MAG TPA: hypothetical protein VL738_44075 [Dactylosporangium sp.]|jgi:hypothetical protein|nr:hypothetical protein [Dactylosporangium sp.]